MSRYYIFAALIIFCTLGIYAENTAFNERHQWQRLGTCTFTNDIIATGNPSLYEVTVEEDLTEPDIFRIVDIWRNLPESSKKRLEREGFTLYYGDDYYIIIDIRDHQYVRIPVSPLGLSDQDGDYSVCTPSEIIGMHVGIDDDFARSKAGKFSDGIVSFSQPGAIYLCQNEWFARSNLHGATSIDLSEYIAGINDITAEDNSVEEYFNLLGMPVRNPGPGIYILRKGAKTSKVLKR